jgi:hypothetical protein
LAYSFEIGPNRPSTETNSLLIRVTRNCDWNKCKFCVNDKGKPFEVRPVSEIKKDIATARIMRDKILEITVKSGKSGSPGGMQKVVGMVLKDPPNESFRNVALWLYGGGENVFLQDANIMAMKTEELVQVLVYLRENFPNIKRVTGYSRSRTAAKKKHAELFQLREAGLNQLHIDLESGFDPVLKYMNQGETASDHIKGGRKVVECGIDLSEFVILGLGGKHLSIPHAQNTARVLNEINPKYIRVRTLIINNKMPLAAEVASGKFVRATDEEMVREERTFIESLTSKSRYLSNHVSNLLPELEGDLPKEKNKMLAILDEFENLSTEDKANFMVGRRVGLYKNVKDMQDDQRHELVEQIESKLNKGQKRLDPAIIFGIMEDFK